MVWRGLFYFYLILFVCLGGMLLKYMVAIVTVFSGVFLGSGRVQRLSRN